MIDVVLLGVIVALAGLSAWLIAQMRVRESEWRDERRGLMEQVTGEPPVKPVGQHRDGTMPHDVRYPNRFGDGMTGVE